jgi:RNA polymerase sigma-70 factor (ECF subfamily)
VLFEKYRNMVARLVFSILKDETQVEDSVQDVFLLLHRNLGKFRRQSALRTWIYRITVNEALRALNRAKRWVSMPEGDLEPNQIPSTIVVFNQGASPERVMVEGERRELIQRALETLKPQHRVVLTLYYLEDLNVQEISEVLDIPEGSVKSRLFYARESLKKALDPILGRINSEERGSHVL